MARGTEFFATRLDVSTVDRGLIERRLLPVTALDHAMYDGLGKTVALLWQLWLVAGADLAENERVVLTMSAAS